MNQFACEHPKKVRNPYTGDWLYVPCGKCSLCLSKRAAHWTERLEFERSCHPFCLFGTLTYSDEFLPKVYFNGDGLLDSRTGELIPFNDLIHYVDNSSFDFISSRGWFGVGDVRDTQLFIKRLREKVRIGSQRGLPDSTDNPESRYIRYFLVQEYGETCFRPHYHFIIFTGSKWFAEHAKSIVSACWSTDNRCSDSKELGIIDVQNVQTSASAYVSSYINGFVDMPKIFQFGAFRPFKIFSKHPPLGTLLPSSKEIQTLFYRGDAKMSVYRRKNNQFVDVPIPAGLCSRLYPKLTGFDKFNPDVLTKLYTLPSDITECSYECFKGFARKRADFFNDSVAEYFKYIFKNLSDSESALIHDYSCLRRVNLQSSIFGVSVKTYSDKIIQFYSTQNLQRLTDFLSYYEEYSKNHSIKTMLLNDRVYLDFVIKSLRESPELCGSIIERLKTYGYDESVCSALDFVESITQDEDVNYLNSVSKANKCIHDSKKKKAKNEYLEYRKMDACLKSYFKNYHSNGFSKNYERVGESDSFSQS